MNTSQKISQAVSIVPIIVAVIVLYMGGSFGTWFIVEEFYQYSATDEDATKLIDYSDYDYYLNEVKVVDYTDPDRQTPLESNLPYSSDGYEQRSTVFYNLGLVLYATMFIALLCSIFIFVLDYFWHDIIKRKLLPGIGKNDILAVIFGGYMAVIVFVLFLALYAVSGIPNAMYEDHYETEKACLYQEDITVIGSVDGCEGRVSGERAILQSVWTVGPAFIIFVIGVLGPSVYLLSTVYQRFEEVVERIESEPELFFDSEGRILFDVNTGEVVSSHVDNDKELFYDEDAMTLFDEGTGEILYAASDLYEALESKDLNSIEDESEEEALAETVDDGGSESFQSAKQTVDDILSDESKEPNFVDAKDKTVDKTEESDVEVKNEAIVSVESVESDSSEVIVEGEAVAVEVVEETVGDSKDVTKSEAVVAEAVEEEKEESGDLVKGEAVVAEVIEEKEE